jgi:hypothetical protein|tara:strand:- start:1072 stop:1452 length:381 start_codon:yes stop_codon:yes gene_type:complete
MKYEKKSRFKADLYFGKEVLEVSLKVARWREGRISYVLGYLGGLKVKNEQDLEVIAEKYDRRREKYDLPLDPFNWGFKYGLKKGKYEEPEEEFKSERPNRGKGPNPSGRSVHFTPKWAWSGYEGEE